MPADEFTGVSREVVVWCRL